MVFVNSLNCAEIIDRLFQKIHLDNPVMDGDEERKWRGYVDFTLLTGAVEILMRQSHFLPISYPSFLFPFCMLNYKIQVSTYTAYDFQKLL